jgi:hypothetical protein
LRIEPATRGGVTTGLEIPTCFVPIVELLETTILFGDDDARSGKRTRW